MKKGILNKLTIVDYIIIIAVICAVVFAFIHITTDDSNDTKTSSYDSSTMNKIVENYLKLYLEGNVVETTVSGYNASTGKAVELHGNYEITTAIAVDELTTINYQDLTNSLYSHDKRISIKGSNAGIYNQLIITRATGDEINLADGILGNFNGATSPITIRIYDCSEQDLKTIENNYNVTNIKTF